MALCQRDMMSRHVVLQEAKFMLNAQDLVFIHSSRPKDLFGCKLIPQMCIVQGHVGDFARLAPLEDT